MRDSHLVSVVIPAYNAEATLDETLRSVRSQTHRALEIIVVDDGSTDDTRQVAERHAGVDPRVRVLFQENAGVAAARNRGWQLAQSDFIAFVDADDLWAPTTIERQLQALSAGSKQVGLVYCWSVRIHSQGEMHEARPGPRWEGEVLKQALAKNFIGNGSSALLRREALVHADGFDSRLRGAGAEGCEDRLLFCRVAETYHFAVVPEHLIGYRRVHENMSSDRPRMLRSWLLVHDELLVRHPEHREALECGLRDYAVGLVRSALWNDLRQVSPLLAVIFSHSPLMAVRVLLIAVGLKLIQRVGHLVRRSRSAAVTPKTGERFLIGDLDS